VTQTQTQIADLNVWGDNTSHPSLYYNIALKTWISNLWKL